MQSRKMPLLTEPGDKECSSSFILEFTAAKVQGEGEELVDNWRHLMIQLVNAFEMWPMDMAKIEREAVDFGNFDIRVKKVKINHTFSRIKRVCVYIEKVFNDKRLKLIFFVKKKQEMKALQTIAAENNIKLCFKEETF